MAGGWSSQSTASWPCLEPLQFKLHKGRSAWLFCPLLYLQSVVPSAEQPINKYIWTR